MRFLVCTGAFAFSAYLWSYRGFNGTRLSVAYRPVLDWLQCGCSKLPSRWVPLKSVLIEYDKGGTKCAIVARVSLVFVAQRPFGTSFISDSGALSGSPTKVTLSVAHNDDSRNAKAPTDAAKASSALPR